LWWKGWISKNYYDKVELFRKGTLVFNTSIPIHMMAEGDDLKEFCAQQSPKVFKITRDYSYDRHRSFNR
jgi:hypothetical protein